LEIDNNPIYSIEEGSRFKTPAFSNPNVEIDAYLMLSEIYLKKKDKIGIANLLYDLRSKKGEYQLADVLITAFWRIANGEDNLALKNLENFIQREPNAYFRNIAKNSKVNLFGGSEDEKKVFIPMECSRNKPYYSLCRLFRLQYFLDLPSAGDKDNLKHFLNIYRVVAPFWEDPKLEWVPYLDILDPEIPAKLAFLGFGKESVYFQQMILDLERLSEGTGIDNALERLSFFQVITGDFKSAEDSLITYLKINKNKKSSYTNRIFLKLGFLSHLQKEYKKSLDYYLQLDFSNWSSNVLHPILNEPLSMTGAKDLIAFTIWKEYGTEVAIKALQKIQDPERLTEDDLWPKLRMAQILMESNYELSMKLADEIIYMAQGKGWRRLEYAATILQGHNQIYKREFRKATVEFTKSRGILDDENKFFSSEFIRNFGFIFAHSASGKKGPIAGNIKDGQSDFVRNAGYEEFYAIRNYRPNSFSTELLFEQAILFWKEDNDYWNLIDTLFSYDSSKKRIQDKHLGISQVFYIDNQFKFLSGFQTPTDSKYFDSSYAEARNQVALQWAKSSEEYASKSLEQSRIPTIIILPYKDSTFLFTYSPKEGKRMGLTVKEWKNNKTDFSELSESIKEFVSSTKDTSGIQIFWNEAGLSAHRNLKKEFKDREISMFGRFQSIQEDKGQLIPISWSCSKLANGIEGSLFEGSRIQKEKDRLHIWDYYPANPKNLQFSEFYWTCKMPDGNLEEISIKRIARRLDYRTIPKTIVYTDKVLNGSPYNFYANHNSWCQFWFLNGTRSILYKPRISEQEYSWTDAGAEEAIHVYSGLR